MERLLLNLPPKVNAPQSALLMLLTGILDWNQLVNCVFFLFLLIYYTVYQVVLAINTEFLVECRGVALSLLSSSSGHRRIKL